MNREIKFRAWDSDDSKMLHAFEEGYRIMYNEDYGTMFCGGHNSAGDWNEPILMQYTGLKDKNGVEIYEGDVLEHNYDKGLMKWVVCYENGCFGIKNGNLLTKFYPIDSASFFTSRVIIGNIYQNPELL